MKPNFITQQHYKRLKELKSIKEFLITQKENFLNEDLYNIELENINKDIENEKNIIKNLI